MNRITKQQVIEGASSAQEKNPSGTITAILTLQKKVVFSDSSSFEEEILKLKGDRILDCQFQVSLIDTNENI